MSEINTAWNEVGTQLNALAIKLKLHYEQAASAEAAATQDALRKLREALDEAFSAVGTAAKDPAVRDDVRNVGDAFANALSTTFSEVSDELRKAFRRD
jgi:Flp pilus assembly pilin Flp